MLRRALLLGTGLLVACPAPCAAALPEARPAPRRVVLPGPDGVYGRFDGSLALALGAGVELEDGAPRGVLRLSAHYLWSAGVYLRYSDAGGAASERPERTASLGLSVRPLYLPRFSLNTERGPALLDLSLDSLAFTAGAFFAQPRDDAFGSERGFELGLAAGVPLFATAGGPWLELGAERRFADQAESAWLFTAALAWHVLALPTED